MRFLADENFPGDAVAELRSRGHEVAWVVEDDSGATDIQVLSRAQGELRVLLTFDKDFGELAFRERLPAACGIVLLRISAPTPAHAVRVILAALESRTDWPGHFAVVEDDQIRMTPLPENPDN